MREIPVDPVLYARDLVYQAAAKAVNDTNTNPTPTARELSVRSAENGFAAAMAEVVFMVEFLAEDEDVKTVESLKAYLLHEIDSMTKEKNGSNN